MHIYIASLGLRLHAILMTRGIVFVPILDMLISGSMGSEEEMVQTFVIATSD
jgi:hypothetical protein